MAIFAASGSMPTPMPLKITVRISSNHFELKMRAQFVPNSCSGLPAYAHAQHSRGINVDGGSLELAIRVGLRFEAQRSHTRGRLTPCSSLDMIRTSALRKFATVTIQENRRRWVAPPWRSVERTLRKRQNAKRVARFGSCSAQSAGIIERCHYCPPLKHFEFFLCASFAAPQRRCRCWPTCSAPRVPRRAAASRRKTTHR